MLEHCRILIISMVAMLLLTGRSVGFAPLTRFHPQRSSRQSSVMPLYSSSTAADKAILPALRTAAMKLHTKEQAPREGQAPAEPREPYTPTRADYLQFLVDSKHVYEALEAYVESHDELAELRNTGLERTEPLAKDIQFMHDTYGLEIPKVGTAGRSYADYLANIKSIPEFLCHYYNFVFAHTAGGRMIGKQMSKLLLDNVTLEFYQWDHDLNELKESTKATIEAIASAWTDEERQECVDATAVAFEEGGGINMYLMEKH